MVEEILSFEKYKAFINAISEDTSLKDPHFEYDENNPELFTDPYLNQ